LPENLSKSEIRALERARTAQPHELGEVVVVVAAVEAFSRASCSGDSWASCWGSSFGVNPALPGPPGPWWPGPCGPPRHWPAFSAASTSGLSWASWAGSSFDWQVWVAGAAPDDDGVVVVVDPAAAEEPVEPEAAVVVVVVGSAAAASAVGEPAVDSATDVSVVPVVPVLWALTACSGRTVRAAMAPPVVTAVPRAATNVLFLMASRLGRGGQMALGLSSDTPPNS
jgi:hypothetical protein